MTILPKKKQRKEKNEADGGSEPHQHHHHHQHHQHHHHHHLHHGNLHVDPGGHIQSQTGPDSRSNRHSSSARGASSSSASGSASLSASSRWSNVASESPVGGGGGGVPSGDETRDAREHHHHHAHHHVAFPVVTPNQGANATSGFGGAATGDAAARSAGGYLSAPTLPSSYHGGHKKRHRASPHSDPEVLNYYHSSRHAQPTDHHVDTLVDHVTARVDARVDHVVAARVEVVDGPRVVEESGGGGGGGGGREEEDEEDDGDLDLGNLSGNNSEDEYYQSNPSGPSDDAEEVEKMFEKQMKDQKGFFVRKMKEDGACLFRAIADQVYGDQEMHDSIRRLCMDYMTKNRDYYSQYITEEFDEYIARKRHPHCHGNYIEMQAISEMFNRPIEVYQVPRNPHQYFYRLEPINIFHGHMKTDNEPLRISYHRNVHYNSVVHPFKATIGVGLGLPAFNPGLAERNLMHEASRISERSHIEQTMLADKIKETDWEATNEAIEEQVARESYLQWLQDQEKVARQGQKSHTRSATATSSSCSSTSSLGAFKSATSGGRSPRGFGGHSPPHPPRVTATSTATTPPLLGPAGGGAGSGPASGGASVGGLSPSHSLASSDSLAAAVSSSRGVSSPRHSPPHRGIQSPGPSTSATRTPPGGRSPNNSGAARTSGFSSSASMDRDASGCMPAQTSATFLGFHDWVSEETEGDIMAQVLAMSQREYFESQMTSSFRQSAASSPTAGTNNTPPPSSSASAAARDYYHQEGRGPPAPLQIPPRPAPTSPGPGRHLDGGNEGGGVV